MLNSFISFSPYLEESCLSLEEKSLLLGFLVRFASKKRWVCSPIGKIPGRVFEMKVDTQQNGNHKSPHRFYFGSGLKPKLYIYT